MVSAVLTTKEYKFSRPMSELNLRLIWFSLFLGVFAKLRMATIHFVTTVCLSVDLSVSSSVRMGQLFSHGVDFFYEILIFEYFPKICAKKNSICIRTWQEHREFSLKKINIFYLIWLSSS